jgi:hypothetical protein
MKNAGENSKNMATPSEAVNAVLPSLINIMQSLRQQTTQFTSKGRKGNSSSLNSSGKNIRPGAIHSLIGATYDAFIKELEALNKLSNFSSNENDEDEDEDNAGASIPALALQVATLLCKAAFGSGFDGVMAYFNNLAMSVMSDSDVSNFLHEVKIKLWH